MSLHAATEPKDVRFHLVDRAGRRVRYRRFVEIDVDREDARSTSAVAEEDPGFADVGGVSPIPDIEASSPSSIGVDDREGPREVEVAYRDLMRGFEVEDDRLVTLEPEEIERARP